LLDKWPSSGYSITSCYRYDRPTLGICFDIGKINSGRYGVNCWEIFWRAVDPGLIAGSSLFEGAVLESENVYCLAIQNTEARCLEQLAKVLEKNADFRQVCASPPFYQGENVFREPLVAAGQVNEAGTITGMSNNARPAFYHVRNERKSAVLPVAVQREAWPVTGANRDMAVRVSPSVRAQSPLKKWWHVWKL
jgi:hypothetical protein